MAGKTRVSALAKELGLTSKEVLGKLTAMGEYVKTASSTIEGPVERRLREAYDAPKPPPPADALMYQPQGLARWTDVSEFLRACKRADRESRPLMVDLASVQFVYPNACVPIAAITQYYKSIGVAFTITNEPYRVRAARVFRPEEATAEALSDPNKVVNHVWTYFDTAEATALTNALVAFMEMAIPMEAGVQQSLNLCLFEIIDNVFEHSEQESGFFMAALHGSSKRLALAVGDVGVGALNSFRDSKYHPRNDLDALTLAVQAGVTSTGDHPRGNGLHTLQRTVEVNRGRLELRTGTGQLLITETFVSSGDWVSQPTIGRENRGFFIDWQLDLSTPVRIEDVYVDLPAIPVNHHLEALENDQDEYVVQIRDHDAGLGTRRAATQLRNVLTNKLSLGAPNLVLDFGGVAVVSASFADEVIGKLAEEFGIVGFMRKFELRNMSQTIEQLLNRAIARRVGTASAAPVTVASQSMDQKHN